MSHDQIAITVVMMAVIGMFMWGRWRHDMVAVGALLACVVLGLVAPGQAFAGFSHPAVVTVACVLVLSRGLQLSGAVDVLSRAVLPDSARPTASIAALAALAAVLSAFMNNVGALALLMPVAIQVASRLDLPPGKLLMPLAFGSILGGTMTLIGTPPNLIVSGFRGSRPDMGAFGMFDFSMVGLPLTAVGVVFIALVGWRLVPARKQAGTAGFETSSYITELRVPEKSAIEGKQVREVTRVLADLDAQMLDLVRNDVYVRSPRPGKVLRAGDILVLEANVGVLAEVLSRLDLKLEEDKPPAGSDGADKGDGARQEERVGAGMAKSSGRTGPEGDQEEGGETPPESMHDTEAGLVEMAVLPESRIVGSSASDLLLRSRYGINLLAVARQDSFTIARLRSLRFKPGDVLLLQGRRDVLNEFAYSSGCVPLAQRDLNRSFEKLS
ncbi:SLC13 family permease [Desulfomicrobium escambiense]|uniref:SLC13 family permease n=1 Tax=Desulfomicrobium escambiense TaxID=29503 RepID=UPI000415FA58|nr:SLC13 family permease [Desulfomicrobium escambiense]